VLSFLAVGALVLAACGSDPTATPRPTNTPSATNTPTPTPRPGQTPTIQPTATPTPVPARDFEAYFRGKQIRVVVGFAPGGGYDTFARLFAKYAPKHVPGNPNFVVQNLAGAGGQRVFEAIDGKTDGYTIANTHPRFYKRELLGDDVPFLDLNTINILGTPSAISTTSAYYVFKDFATSWQDAIDRGLEMTDGNTAPGDTGSVGAAFIELLGGPIRQISGYGGTSEIAAAFDRREITGTSRGNYDNGARLFPEWVAEKSIVPLFWYGAPPEEDEAFTDYVVNQLGAEIPPSVFEALEIAGISVSEGQKTVFSLTEQVNDKLSRTFALPDGVPDDILAFWNQAFKETLEDEEFIAAAAVAGYPVAYGSPEDIRQTLSQGQQALGNDPALKELFAALAGTE
jgi:tripartite-type tricarboxylate transporter receptor subunit TctC